MTAEAYSERVYPIGVFSERELTDIRLDPLCVDKVGMDALLDEWRAKSAAFKARERPSLDTTDSDVLPLQVGEPLKSRIEQLLFAYRPYLPPSYQIALVPISKLISPQKHVLLEYARTSLGGLERPLTDDENADYCLGRPVRDPKIDSTFLGYESVNHGSKDIAYIFQFSSDDNNMRLLPPMPLKPIQDIDLATEGATEHYSANVLSISVGPGLPFVHVLKVPVRIDQSTRKMVYRLIISNGTHRVFRLAQLKNTHAAAVIQTIDRHEIPDPYVETPRDALFTSGALRIEDLADDSLNRVFRWKKGRRVMKLRVRVSEELSFVS